MKLVFFVKSKKRCPICDGIHTELEHADTIKKIKKQNLSEKEAAKEIAMDHGEEVDKKNPKLGVKKYYKELKKMEKKLKKSSDDIILNFIRRKGNAKIKDSEIHSLAKRLGMSSDRMEEKIYKLLQTQLKKSGDFSPAQKKALKHGKKSGEGRKARKHLKGKSKVGVVMHEWKQGTLHHGRSGKIVPKGKKGQKIAVAIAMSEAGMSKKK